MAKAATMQATVPATTKSDQLPAGMADQLMADAGIGYENVGLQDKVIPFVSIAQGLSPQLDENDAKYIPGLKLGDIFNNANNYVWSGRTGIKFVPAAYNLKYQEWKPREKGGGYIGEHGPEILKNVKEEERDGKFGRWLPNGNNIVIAGVWFGLIVDTEPGFTPQPAVISFTSTQLKKSKKLMSLLDDRRAVRPDVNDGKPFKPAMFYNVLEMTVVQEQNDKGKWGGWRIQVVGDTLSLPDGSQIYMWAKEFHEAVLKNEVRTAEPPADGLEGEDDGRM